MTGSPIDDYIGQVASHLKLRGAARRQALSDLFDILSENATATSARSAVEAAGPAREYAATLDDMFGTTEGAYQTILGVPNSFTRGFGRRMAGTFAPADPRLFVPRVFGAGWALNMGAVAVRLGLLHPDDVDDEVLTQAVGHLPAAQAAASLTIATGFASGLLLLTRRRRVAGATGKSQTGNVISGLAVPLAAAALLAASNTHEVPAAQRLTAPASAATLGIVATGANLQFALRPKGRAVFLASLLGALPADLLLSYLPVRAALRQHWHRPSRSEDHA